MPSEVAVSEFVGRERELAVLRGALDEARAGQGGVVVLAGEPGIGKTRTAKEFARTAEEQGIGVLWGTCYEGGWSPPYGPWLEAVDGLVRALTAEALGDRLGDDARVLADAVPAIREALPGLAAAPRLRPEESQYRFYDAFARFLVASSGQGLAVVLDDVHWADRGSLGLLEYLGRVVGDSGLLVVATYSDVDLGLGHPLAACLADLDHHGAGRRVALVRLDEQQSRELAELLYRHPLGPKLAAAVLRETEGNPFFIGEVVRHLREQGEGDADLGIPESVRQAVDRRLARLSSETGRMLSVAAAFTRPFTFAVLQPATGMPEATLLDCLDEALRARMIRVAGHGERYEFAHTLVRHALYEELSPSRRARLHRRIAEALERVHAGRELDYAAELAHQYRRSASLPGAEHGLRYALSAALQAESAHAPAEAAEFLRLARDLAEKSDPSLQADVLCRLALVEADALELDEAASTADQALAALRESGASAPTVAEFLGQIGMALKEGGAGDALLDPIVRQGLAAAGERRDLVWARLMLVRLPLERRRSGPLEYAVWRGFDSEALAIARRSGDELEYARSLEPIDTRTRAEAEELLELVRGWTHPAAKIHGLTVVARVLLYRHGAISASTQVAEELLAASEASGSLSGRAYALVLLAEIEAARGEFASARSKAESAREMIARLGPGHRLRRWRAEPGLLVSHVGGDWSALARVNAELAIGAGAGWPWMSLVAAGAALAHARAGEREEAERLLAAVTPAIEDQEAVAPRLSEAVGEAAAVVWELELADYAERYRRLALAQAEEDVGDPVGSSSALTVARMASLLGETAEAEQWFARARERLEDSGQRPLRAIVDYDEALARRRSGEGGASELLDAARAQFHALGMTFWRDQAEALAASPREGLPAGLTAREAEVLRLLTAGRTNKQIAAELVLSVHTVERHLANVYAKIGARNRADAAAFAVRCQL